MTLPVLLALIPAMSQYGISNRTIDGVPVVLLEDTTRQVVVSIAPSIGNIAYSMKVNGVEVLWSPYKSPGELKAKPALLGNPFLAPWANRIEGMSYWVNGKKYAINPAIGNVRQDQNKNPIHGLALFTSAWRVVQAGVDERGALVRSRLEFYRDPEWMAQFPFAHAIEMTYRLHHGELEVITEIENLSTQPFPVAIGYHPYFQLPGGREAWTVHIPAREHVDLSPTLIPNGKRSPVNLPDPLAAKDHKLDDVFTNLIRDKAGNAEFWMSNGKQKLSLVFGPKFPVGVVYAPGRDFVCFEPMAAITDAFNQNHKGQYPELQSIAPGGKWRESWWIRPSGF